MTRIDSTERGGMAKTIFDGIHGYTKWGSVELRIIDTPEFQRLRDIKQLGVCYRVFPSASHNRFEHSLGVGYLAESFSTHLMHAQPELHLTTRDVLLFKIAGLAHDLGHGPISHGFDMLLTQSLESAASADRWCEHEHRSCAIFRYIVSEYQISLTEEQLDIVCELILPQKMDLPPYFYQIVANVFDDIDVDKFDYIKRDCRMIGLSNNIDIRRFFEYSRVIDQRICYPTKMQFDVQHLLTTRHQLHAQIYQHPVVRALEWMHIDFLKIIDIAWCDRIRDICDFCSLTDRVFSAMYLETVRTVIGETRYAQAKALLRRIHTRNLYRFVGEVKLRTCDADKADLKRDLPKLPSDLTENDIMIDLVQIGYVRSPLLSMRFYDMHAYHNDQMSPPSFTLDASLLSTVCTEQPRDSYLRVYVKNDEKLVVAKRWATDIIAWYGSRS